MFTSPTVLTLIVTAVFTAAAWTLGSIHRDAECSVQSKWPKDEPELHRDVARVREPGAVGNASGGSKQGLRFAYDDMFDESGSH